MPPSPAESMLPGRAALGRRPRRRLRVILRRQPITFWAVVVVAAATAWWATHTATARISKGAEAYGELVEVLVANSDIDAGSTIADDHVRFAALPVELVPSDAATLLPPDTAARERIVAGEAIVTSRLAPQGAMGVAARLGADERAVAIPLEGHALHLSDGQVVDVVATLEPTSRAGRPSRVVARAARVVAVSESGITVAVDEDEALDLATSLATAVVTVTLTSG